MEAKKSLWNCENLRSGQGHFATKSQPYLQLTKKKGGWGAWSPTCARFFSCYAFESMNTSKMTQTERTGKKFFMYMY